MDHETLFSEQYRVVAVDEGNLVLRGTHSGELVTLRNARPEIMFSSEEFAVGKLVAFSDPTADLIH